MLRGKKKRLITWTVREFQDLPLWHSSAESLFADCSWQHNTMLLKQVSTLFCIACIQGISMPSCFMAAKTVFFCLHRYISTSLQYTLSEPGNSQEVVHLHCVLQQIVSFHCCFDCRAIFQGCDEIKIKEKCGLHINHVTCKPACYPTSTHLQS